MRIVAALAVVVFASTAGATAARAEDTSCAFLAPDDVAITWVGDRHQVELGWSSGRAVPWQRLRVVLDHPSGRRINTAAMSSDKINPLGVTFVPDHALDFRAHYVVKLWLLDCDHHWKPHGEWVEQPEEPRRYRCGNRYHWGRDEDVGAWRGRFAATVLILGALLLVVRARRHLHAFGR